MASGDQQYKAGLGKRIVEIRKMKGISQKSLAGALEISPTRLNYWEKGKAAPAAIFIDKIAKVLEVPVSTLMGWDEQSGFNNYLASIGFTVTEVITKWHDEPEDQGFAQIPDEIETEVCSIYTGKKYTFTSKGFEQFRLNIKQAVEFALYQSENK